MSGPCMYCGGTNYSASMGGPWICPSCDCGNFGPDVVKRQGETIVALQAAAVEKQRLNAKQIERAAEALMRIRFVQSGMTNAARVWENATDDAKSQYRDQVRAVVDAVGSEG